MTKYSYIVGFLTTGLAMTSCSSYDEDSFSDSRGSVVTQISLSVSGKSTTRITESVVQSDNESFLGMQDIFLIPFIKTVTDDNHNDPIESNDHRIGSRIQLPAIGNEAANTIGTLNANNNSKLYYDVSIPTGTNSFLIYGRSIHNSDDDYANDGKIVATGLDGNPSEMSFSLQPIISAITDDGAAGATGNAIITYLNTIFKTQEGIDWSSVDAYPALYALYPMLQNMKAGSSASVIAFVQEIYDALKASSSASGVNNVLTAITNTNYVTIDEDGVIAFNDTYENYPGDVDLPDGAAVIEWDETNKKFKAVTSKNNLGAMNVDVTNYVYPAELWYRTNSFINTDIESRAEEYTKEANDTWPKVLNQYAVEYGSVDGGTKSVAVRQQLEYAVSRLDVRLEAKDGNTTLEKLVDIAGTEFDLAGLPITGILVGQQSPVDYLFQSKWEQEGDHPLYTIYDSAIEGTINAKDNDNKDVYTHTLVLETAKDQTVNVAIELLNNSGESILTRVPGDTEDQIIPNGCKFYLVGQLIPTAQDGYVEDGENWQNRVFCQDHITQVTFTVSDLTKAYYVIPPLSSADLEISLGTNPWIMSTPAGFEME